MKLLKLILGVVITFCPGVSNAAVSRSFALSSWLSYRLYQTLNVDENATAGGQVKSLMTQHMRLDCYHLPRYTCSLNIEPFALQTGPRGRQELTFSDAAASSALYNALNVMPDAGVKRVESGGTSLSCSSASCVVVLHEAAPEPLPPPQPAPTPNCHLSYEACSYYGWCYQPNSGRFDYGYCYGMREYNSCSGTWSECY